MPAIDLRTAAIHIRDTPELPVAFAAQELQRYLRDLIGVELAIATDLTAAQGARLALGEAAAIPPPSSPDAFVIEPTASGVTLAAESPRALLHASYALLEQLGCRWAPQAWLGDAVPRRPAAAIEVHPQASVPPFSVRGYCSDIMTWHYTQPEYLAEHLDEDRAFIDWMAKSGATTFFFIRHPFDTQLAIPELLPEFARRGIEVEYGGHVIPLLLPREAFREHPEYFPQGSDGARTDHGNLCASNPDALSTAGAHAVAYAREHAEMRAVHIWGADLWRGGWCHCAACRAVSVQDQSLRVCNAVARALAEAGVSRRVCYLAYHDTLEPALTLRPDDHVAVEFAPRERCYGHALNDPACATNRGYAAALERYVELFDGRVRLFEYYGDAILFLGCAVPLSEVIAADLAYYRGLGVREITSLQFGAFSLWAYPLNLVAFAAGVRAGDAPVAIDDYCRRLGTDADGIKAAWTELEATMCTVVTYGDIRRPPRSGEGAARVAAQLEAALPRLAAVSRRLDDAAPAALAPLVRYTHAILDGVRRELRSALAGRPRSDEGQYAAALQIMQGVSRRFTGVWGSVDLPMIHGFYAAPNSFLGDQ